MQLCVLGRVAVVADGEEHVLGAKREAALLADLIVHAGQVVSSVRLVEDLWRGAPTPGAASTLQTYVKNVRRLLEPGRGWWASGAVLSTVRPGYVLRIDPDGLDAWRCEQLVAEARSRLPDEPAVAAGLLHDAAALCRGPAFGELATEAFLEAEAARLDELQLVALELRVEAGLALGLHRELAGELHALTAAQPYRESLWRLSMMALYRSGRQADALRAYQQLRRRLAEDLGISPGAPLRDLEAAILQQRPELDLASAPSIVAGNHGATPTPLLVERDGATRFVGRQREQAAVLGALRTAAADHQPVVVTLTGPGGVGKTRLARRVAAALAVDSSGGAQFVDLVGVTADANIAEVVLAAVEGERYPGQADIQALAEVGRQVRRLVVLDNCEHVVAGAAPVAMALAAGGCHVLATSRQPLGVPGERVIPLVGLDVADAAEVFLDVAARLGTPGDLHERAADIAELCRQLDGLPLAIELAAARSRALSVPDLLTHLGARFRLLRSDGHGRHHRSLHATVQWSFDLLAPGQRQLFARLSVFRGGFDLAAATAVAGAADVDELDVVDGLDALVARSVVVADVDGATTRYGMLETLRAFAEEQLAGPDAVETAARHAHHYLTRAEWAAEALFGTEPTPARDTFDREWDNLRAALDHMIASADVDGAVRLACAVNAHRRPGPPEVAAWYERVLRMPNVDQHPNWTELATRVIDARREAGDLGGAERLMARVVAHDAAIGRPRFSTLVAAFTMAWSRGRLHDAAALLEPLRASLASARRPDAQAIVGYFRVITALFTSTEDPRAVAAEADDLARSSQRPYALALAALGRLAVDVIVEDGTSRRHWFDEVRRWSALVGDRALPKNAALWMIERRSDPPELTLSYARHTLLAARDEGQWATMDVTLRRIVPALVALERHEPAATLLGGLTTIESSLHDHDLTQLEAAEAVLRTELGPRLESSRARGATMHKAELVAFALAAIEDALPANPEGSPSVAEAATS